MRGACACQQSHFPWVWQLGSKRGPRDQAAPVAALRGFWGPANHIDFFSSGFLWRGPCVLFLCGSALYRAGAGWHRSAKTKRRFAAQAHTLNAHCLSFVRFASFAAFKKRVTVHRPVDQQPRYQSEQARCAGCGLVTKFGSKITDS